MKTSGFIFIIACIVLGIWDAIALTFGIENTVSWWMRSVSFESPMIPFSIGVLCGHFFGYMKPESGENGKDL